MKKVVLIWLIFPTACPGFQDLGLLPGHGQQQGNREKQKQRFAFIEARFKSFSEKQKRAVITNADRSLLTVTAGSRRTPTIIA